MNPAKVRRSCVRHLTDLPNVGPVVAGMLKMIDIHFPEQLAGRDPLQLYRDICNISGKRQDPCLLDVMLSITRFMDGAEPQPWWAYTEERKHRFAQGHFTE